MLDIIYLRTSTEDQNPQNHLSDVKTITPKNWVMFEEQQSAWKDHINNRPAFKQIIDLIKQGDVASVNVWDLDRFFRNRIRTVEFMQLCKFKNVVVRSFRQKWLTEIENIPPPWNEIMREQLIQIFAWIGEEESNKKSERIKNAVRKNRKGQTVSYKGNKWGRAKVKVDAYKVILLRRTLSIRNTAKELNVDKGVIERCLKNLPPDLAEIYKSKKD
jgi:DNA invertase Pin-like site-specific DNA recombinase